MSESLNLLTDLIANAQKAGATAADALFYDAATLSVTRRMRQPEGLERSESRGISLRVFVDKCAAVVSSSDTGNAALAELVERAVAMAKLAPDEPYATLAPEGQLAKSIPELDLYDAQEPSPEWLQEQCAVAEDAALAVKGVTNSEGADASFSHTQFALAASNGFAGQYRSSSASFSVSVLAGKGTGMERDYDFTQGRFISDLSSPHALGINAATRALARLNARKCGTQSVPVIYDPRVSKSLLGSFAGAINGSAVARGTSFLKDAMGRQVFAPSIRIIDDPHIIRGLGSRPFDAEGVANRKIALVEDGILQSWLLDMRSANRLQLTTTGHASRSLSSPPSPGTTNFYLEAGSLSPKELMSDIVAGFYVTEVFGMGVNLTTGDYSQGASGFWIENGEITYPVSEVTIAGRLQDMFRQMTPASDLEFRYSTNAPTLRVEEMMLAGK